MLEFTIKGDEVTWTWEGHDEARVEHAQTEEASFMLMKLPEVVGLFLEKNAKYRLVQTGYELGAKGIVPDLNRKLGIIVDRIWEGNPEHGESTEEVIMDMIGHLFLMLAKVRKVT